MPPRFFDDGISAAPFAQHAPYRRTQFGMQNRRRVLEFSVLSDSGGLAVTFH
jgi:hypothetical protein